MGLTVKDTRFLMTSQMMGANISWLFFGFLLKQIYTYCHRSNGDSLYFRHLVSVTIAIQFFDTAAFSYAAYGFGVQAWGITILNDAAAETTSVFSNLSLLDLSLASATTQWFFTWRILTFAKAAGKSRWRNFSKVTSVLILLLSICASACGVFLFVAAFFLEGHPKWWIPLLLLVNATMAVADILITVSMTGLLLHAKAQTRFGETRDIVTRFMRITLQTGLLTSFLALSGLALMAAELSYYAIFWEVLTKSYAVSLFANLNARGSHLRNPSHGSTGRGSFGRRGDHSGSNSSGLTLHLLPLKGVRQTQSVNSSIKDDGNSLELPKTSHASSGTFTSAGEELMAK